jgi:DNA topoisomerase-3
MNYLEVFTYDKWIEQSSPSFQLGDTFIPNDIVLNESKTQAPRLLSESDLIAEMDKNGIGTDATIHEHIKTV